MCLRLSTLAEGPHVSVLLPPDPALHRTHRAPGGHHPGVCTDPSSPGVSAAVPRAEATPPSASTSHPFAGDTAWIAYYSGEGIGLIHPDGTDDHQVASDAVPGEELLADWSPDGTRLVFTTRGGETEPIYEYDLATERSRQLFACEDPCIGDDEPVYTPDGQRVSFIRALGPFVTSAEAEATCRPTAGCGSGS